jgi:Na+/proline symporter
MKTLTTQRVIVTVTAAVTCSATPAMALTGGGDSSELVVWGFLGFCALIIVGQLLPAFFSFMSAKKVAEKRLQEELAARETQQTPAVSKKSE